MSAKVAEIFETMDYGPAPESDKTASQWLEQHGRSFGHFINGAFVKPAKGKSFATKNPATGEMLAKIACGGKAEVDAAVKAAEKALKPWQALDGFGRAKYLYALARLIQKNSRLLAVVESMDNGKPIRETRDIDVNLAARHFYHHAGWAQLLDTEFPGYEGYGVVLNPAEFTPLSAVLFADLCQEAGLPAGVVNIVQGDGGTGAEITKHP